jgi:hypothetical protein
MRTRLLARRRTAPVTDPGSRPVEFEFAHLLDAVSQVALDVVPDLVPDLEADLVVDVVVDVVADVVPAVVVSRFADSGLDDDRLPVAVKRRRGRRR